jgi:hypothetical protein
MRFQRDKQMRGGRRVGITFLGCKMMCRAPDLKYRIQAGTTIKKYFDIREHINEGF